MTARAIEGDGHYAQGTDDTTPLFSLLELLTMRQLLNGFQTRLLCGLLTCGLAMPVFAQQQDQQQQDRQQQDRQQQDRQQQDQQQQDQQQQDQQQQDRQQQDRQQQDRQQQGAKLKMQPAGWISVGVDYDGDGRFEAIETIYAYDLQLARQQSKKRQAESQRRGQQSDMQRRQTAQRSTSIEGELQSLNRTNMRGHDETFVLGRVRTDDGRTARVLLGTEDRLTSLNLSEGDQVMVRGRRGTVNDRGMFIASQVRAGGSMVDVQPKQKMQRGQSQQRQPQQVQGTLVRTRQAKFRGHDRSFIVGELRTQEGERQLINMGPKEKFSDINFDEAGQIKVMGRTGSISGKEALIAEKVQVNGETIQIKPDTQRDQRWRQQQREASARDRQERQRQR